MGSAPQPRADEHYQQDMRESLRTAAYQTESALRHHPIEEAFSKIKSILRKMGARTHETLTRHSSKLSPKLSQRLLLGMSSDGSDHCGYQVEIHYL
jgi:hypothetical protein